MHCWTTAIISATVFTQTEYFYKNLSSNHSIVDRSLRLMGYMPWIILRRRRFLCFRDAVCRGNKITELGLFPMMEHDMGRLFCCLAHDYTIWICHHKHLALQEFHKFVLEFSHYYYRYYFIKCLNWINEFLAPSALIRLSSLDASACLSMSLSRLSGPWFRIPVAASGNFAALRMVCKKSLSNCIYFSGIASYPWAMTCCL